MNDQAPVMVKCPLCGKEFDRSQTACSNCPFHGKCEMLKCPNCGFEFVSESKIVNFFSKLFKSPPKADREENINAHPGNR